MKFCKDCVHLDRSMIVDSYCKHPSATYSINRVSGRESFNTAYYMRQAHSKCGPDATHFEQKIFWYDGLKKWLQK